MGEFSSVSVAHFSRTPNQPGSLTFKWYDVGPEVPPGHIRALEAGGQFTTTIDQVALAFTAPSNLPPAGVYQEAIELELKSLER